METGRLGRVQKREEKATEEPEEGTPSTHPLGNTGSLPDGLCGRAPSQLLLALPLPSAPRFQIVQ